MDEKNAWKAFEKTGEISDYLEYCKHKKSEEAKFGEKSKS